nr:hypothetical protein Iba_chr06aCG17190 [Ipomoea batatas]
MVAPWWTGDGLDPWSRPWWTEKMAARRRKTCVGLEWSGAECFGLEEVRRWIPNIILIPQPYSPGSHHSIPLRTGFAEE